MTITFDPNNILSGLMELALVGAIFALAIAIIVYPSLKERAKKTPRK